MFARFLIVFSFSKYIEKVHKKIEMLRCDVTVIFLYVHNLSTS